MTYVADDPAGHLLRLLPLIFKLCELDKDGVVNAGQFISLPPDLWPVEMLELNPFMGWMEYVMDRLAVVMEWEAFEVGLDWESLGVPLAQVFETT